MNHKNSRLTIATIMTPILAVALAACTSSSGGTESPVSDTCTSSAPTVTPSTPTVALLGETGTNLKHYDPDINLVIKRATADKARVLMNGVAANNNAPDLLSNVVMTGEGDNNLQRTQNLTCKTKTVRNAIKTLTEGHTPAQMDTFSAINTLAGNLHANPSTKPVDVVLLTPLAAHGGGVDLSKPTTLDHPVTAINTLAKNGLIPTCIGYRFYGVSPTTGMNDVQAAKLRQFWLLYAKKCGGTFVAWTDHLATFPIATAITQADYTQLKVTHTDHTVTATLGSDVLFTADSAHLNQAAASKSLEQLRTLTTDYPGKIVITGYVNPVVPGTNTRGDLQLSLQRAAAVSSWLINHKVAPSRITTLGRGTADPIYTNPASAAQSAANRRVVVVIYTQAR